MTALAHRWLPGHDAAGRGELTLFCFPHAGARWTSFRDWEEELPGFVAVASVEYPRVGPASETPFETAADLARSCYESMRQTLSTPAVLYGHSLGSIIAFEVARLMTADGIAPLALVVSGHSAPGAPPPERPVHQLPSTAFWSRIEAWGGLPAAIADDPAARACFEGGLRGDLRLSEHYRPTPGRPLACPIVAMAGLADSLAPPEAMEAWRACTAGPFTLERQEGDHFFPVNRRPQFLRQLGRVLEDIWC
jgi:medium-chain acyl-[acyl-carrier-protein] hydrolase